VVGSALGIALMLILLLILAIYGTLLSIRFINTRLSWRRYNKKQRMFDRQLCEQCGYDLRASTRRCPECGHPMPRRTGF